MKSIEEIKKAWTQENTPLGKLLGYPDCCIRAFCDQPPEIIYQTKPTEDDKLRFRAGCINGEFTGFIPCIAHAKEIIAGKITLAGLISNRDKTLKPFPLAFDHGIGNTIESSKCNRN